MPSHAANAGTTGDERIARSRARRPGRWLALGAWLPLFGLSTCPPGEPGRLVLPDTRFARSDVRLIATARDGIRVVDLEGAVHEPLFGGSLSVLDVSDDGRLFVLRDPDTNLYIGRRGGPERRIPALDGRASAAALAPDGRTVAASRHYGWGLPRRLRGDDDTVYLIDVATGAVTTIPPASGDWPTWVAWEWDGRAVWLGLLRIRGAHHERSYERVTIPEGERTRLAFPDPRSVRRPPIRPPGPECTRTGVEVRPRGFKGDEGLDLIHPDGTVRRLVIVEGRVRSGHDPYETVRDPGFTPDCRHVVFHFHADLHAVDVETGAIRRIGPARDWFLDPAVHPPGVGPTGALDASSVSPGASSDS